MGFSLRRLAPFAREKFLAKAAKQRRGFYGFFFAPPRALCERTISRQGRKATQRFFYGFSFALLRALSERTISRRVRKATQRFFYGFFFALLRALCERKISRQGRKATQRFFMGFSLRRLAPSARNYNPLTILVMPSFSNFTLKLSSNPNFRPLSLKYVNNCFL